MATKKERLKHGGRYRPIQLSVFILFVSTFFFAEYLCAASNEISAGFRQWVQDLRHEALITGISANTFDPAFEGVEPIERVIELDRNQPEFKLSLEEYINRVASKKRVARGKELLLENRDLLQEIHSKYGVPPHILVALWGVETDFGRITGDFPVVAVLATLAHDGRRSDFFRREVLAALHILEKGTLRLEQMRGSWAGAMGNLQFLPSVFASYATDYNNNGRIDVWQERGDIFASGANFLQSSGWQSGLKWGIEVTMPPDFDPDVPGNFESKSVEEWQRIGVMPLAGTFPPDNRLSASIIRPDGTEGRSFLVYANYQALLIWNRSDYFAIGVGLFADQLELANKE